MNTGELQYLSGLNQMQRKAVLHSGPPLLILAGAGSGKTRVITTKIVYLINQLKVDPGSILAVTFTNKAAKEMSERAAALEPAAGRVLIRTFHSFGAWLLRRYSKAAGLSPRFTIYDDNDSTALLQSLYPDKVKIHLRRYSHMISRAKDYSLQPGDDLWKISTDEHLPEMYAAYQKRLGEIGNADFGDLILKPAELLKNNPDIAGIVRSRFRVILVDEYQDSNVAQYELLKILKGEDAYLCVVGDDDQSIYRFRGAEVKNILTFHESFPGTEIIKLEENYRSTDIILDAASAVVANNSGRLGKTLFTERQGSLKIHYNRLANEDAEAEYCAAEMDRTNLGETAILYRTNAQSRAFETYFLRHEIPYRIVGTTKFYEREEVKDALSMLSFLVNPRDEIAFRRIVNKPARGIGSKSLETIIRAGLEADGDFQQALRRTGTGLSHKAGKGIDEFITIVDTLQDSLERKNLADFMEEVMVVSGLIEYYRLKDETLGRQNKKVQNLHELVNAAADPAIPSGVDGLVEFLESIELDRSREGDDGLEREKVTLITMHNTKGLEFERVFITGLDEGLFPRGGEESAEDLEEERRLFYVALTRAKDEIFLTSCMTRRINGKLTNLDTSRFVREIPEDLLHMESRTGSQAPGESGSELDVGMYIYHDDYGQGVVCKKWYNGEDSIVIVRFESGRTAQFFPAYTPLERVQPDV
jgi:DNA helicase II / ATP-dependent DNA helicase PcrA